MREQFTQLELAPGEEPYSKTQLLKAARVEWDMLGKRHQRKAEETGEWVLLKDGRLFCPVCSMEELFARDYEVL